MCMNSIGKHVRAFRQKHEGRDRITVYKVVRQQTDFLKRNEDGTYGKMLAGPIYSGYVYKAGINIANGVEDEARSYSTKDVTVRYGIHVFLTLRAARKFAGHTGTYKRVVRATANKVDLLGVEDCRAVFKAITVTQKQYDKAMV